jgi:lysophospholipase L1-like esterase
MLIPRQIKQTFDNLLKGDNAMKEYSLPIVVIVWIALLILLGWNGRALAEQYTRLQDVPEAIWQKLAEETLYFGHQSVGFNILYGIADVMKAYPQITLKIAETQSPADFQVPLFGHSRVGQNEDPQSKINAFANVLQQGVGTQTDFAMLKFCYVDFAPKTDTSQVFNAYQTAITQLRQQFPNVRIIHLTAPLTVSPQSGPKAWVKSLLGRPPWDAEENIKRNQYNALLKAEYAGKEPVFDIAEIESTFPNGKRSSFKVDGKEYYQMVPEYTDDGGHLNEKGRKIVAERLLLFLANLVE